APFPRAPAEISTELSTGETPRTSGAPAPRVLDQVEERELHRPRHRRAPREVATHRPVRDFERARSGRGREPGALEERDEGGGFHLASFARFSASTAVSSASSRAIWSGASITQPTACRVSPCSAAPLASESSP